MDIGQGQAEGADGQSAGGYRGVVRGRRCDEQDGPDTSRYRRQPSRSGKPQNGGMPCLRCCYTDKDERNDSVGRLPRDAGTAAACRRIDPEYPCMRNRQSEARGERRCIDVHAIAGIGEGGCFVGLVFHRGHHSPKGAEAALVDAIFADYGPIDPFRVRASSVRGASFSRRAR